MVSNTLDKAIAFLVIVLIPGVALADSGEGLIELLFVQAIRMLNIVWPFLLPIGLLGRARKKLSFYLYALFTCGASAWLLIYVAPQQILSFLGPEFSVNNLRIALIYMFLATAIAIFVSIRICSYIREFNDSHD